jgi:hypothetical protein
MTHPSAQEYFRMVLLTVVGQALGAAEYTLEDNPVQWAGGQIRFRAQLVNGLYGFIMYQHLAYAEPAPSRFRVSVVRTDLSNPNLTSRHPQFDRHTLSMLVVEVFGVAILPSADYWWTYHNTTELGKGLAESGHLIAGYGIPWLAGTLVPSNKQQAGD